MEDEDGTPGPPEFLHPSIAADIAAHTVEAWMKLADCTACIVAISGSRNWRKLVMPTYKANRSGMARPLPLSTVRRSLMDRFDHRVVDGLEADDVLGILATRPKFADAVIVSPDKDLLTIPGRHLSPLKADGIIVTT